MCRRGFGRVIAEVRLAVAHHAGHAGDDDHTAGHRARCPLEEWKKGDDGEENARNVSIERRVPRLHLLLPQVRLHLRRVAGVGEPFGARHPGRRHDERQIRLLRLQLGRQLLEVLLRRHVARSDWDDLTVQRVIGGVRAVCPRSVIENLSPPTRDVDFGS